MNRFVISGTIIPDSIKDYKVGNSNFIHFQIFKKKENDFKEYFVCKAYNHVATNVKRFANLNKDMMFEGFIETSNYKGQTYLYLHVNSFDFIE